MHPSLADRPRRLTRACIWSAPALLLALAPKCVLCVLAYAGLGTALGLAGPEICGETTELTTRWVLWLLVVGASLGLFGFFTAAKRHGERGSIARRDQTQPPDF